MWFVNTEVNFHIAYTLHIEIAISQLWYYNIQNGFYLEMIEFSIYVHLDFFAQCLPHKYWMIISFNHFYFSL